MCVVLSDMYEINVNLEIFKKRGKFVLNSDFSSKENQTDMSWMSISHHTIRKRVEEFLCNIDTSKRFVRTNIFFSTHGSTHIKQDLSK